MHRDDSTFSHPPVSHVARFPSDFMLRFRQEEARNLMYQYGASSGLHEGRRHLPLAFTEHAVAIRSTGR